ncbi:monosaccharide ABC transporter substrate-binding protein (CUT2 family) [Thioclava sp. ES.031]|uniref:TMAO reductase system periplasmic protein TorT n=1 Tax=Thioclava sp. ES.031 TaxID=1798203 RepID=UPI000BF7E43B|nr:TMAO reductase system periplasmic protein TorT [Thioclava sp. ES.031]PFG63075.1 monosaccharide ABC transporter substrate-binding protein (CUT2 family) [Thioclava sp. ES.031]
MKHVLTSVALLGATCAALPAMAEDAWFPYPAEEVVPAFSADGTAQPIEYEALAKADKDYKICVSFPHMKDAYWLGVDYGVTEEAKREGVSLNVVEAGGYTNLAKQISQIEDCAAGGAQAVIIGAISYDGLNSVVKELADKNIPVIDLVNGMSSPDLAAKSLVSFETMGKEIGSYLAQKHPEGSDEVTVGWFPGPAGAGWVEAANKGFMEAVKGSAVKVLEPRYGDTGKEAQLKLVEDVLQANPEVSYIAGTAVTAEVAQGLLRERGLTDKVGNLAFYLTPGVYSGIQRGFIEAAPADSMVIQGRIAVDQAVRILEGKDYVKHVGPKIFVITKDNIEDTPRSAVLPPDGFQPVFSVN